MQVIKIRSLVLYSLFIFLSNTAHAGWFGSTNWKPFISLGAGATSSSKLGRTQNFPIQDISTDQFYNYSASSRRQTVTLFEVFLGGESRTHQGLSQTGFAYKQNLPFKAKGTVIQGADAESADSYRYQYKILSRQLLLQSKWFYTFKSRFHPYFVAGLGIAFNKAYAYQTNVPTFLTPTRTYADNTVKSVAYVVGVGLDGDLTKNLRLGIGYRYANLGKVKLGAATIDSTSVSGTLKQSTLHTNELIGELTWIFT